MGHLENVKESSIVLGQFIWCGSPPPFHLSLDFASSIFGNALLVNNKGGNLQMNWPCCNGLSLRSFFDNTIYYFSNKYTHVNHVPIIFCGKSEFYSQNLLVILF